MHRLLCALAIPAWLFVAPATLAKAPKPLEIYFIDVEGGQATLIVDPRGESLLIDTGWPGFGGRDAGRILAAARAAGLKQIDYVLITHYHSHHVGVIPQRAQRITVGISLDHGPHSHDSHPHLNPHPPYHTTPHLC